MPVAGAQISESLERLRGFLVDNIRTSAEVARSYVLALEKGRLTRRLLRDAGFNLSPTQETKLLEKLCLNGFLVRSPERGRPGNPGGRGRGKVYVPRPPQDVLRPMLSAASSLTPHLGLIGEHLENLPKGRPEETSEVWILEHAQILPEFEAQIASARQSIMARGNDMEWLTQGDVLDLLRGARRRGVDVSLAAKGPSDGVRRTAKKYGLRIARLDVEGVPVAVFDRDTAMVAYRTSSAGTSYRCLLIHSPYLAKLLEKSLGMQKGGTEK